LRPEGLADLGGRLVERAPQVVELLAGDAGLRRLLAHLGHEVGQRLAQLAVEGGPALRRAADRAPHLRPDAPPLAGQPLALALPALGVLAPLALLLLREPGELALLPLLRPAGVVAYAGAHVLGHPRQLLAQSLDRVADVLLDLAGDVAHRGRDLLLQLLQLVEAGVQLGAALVGDGEDLLAADHLVGDQPLGLQAGQPRVDGARGGRVDAEEAVLQQPDHFVPVPRALLQQLEQIQPEPAVAEDGAHSFSPLSSVTSPETVVADREAMPPPSRPDIDRPPGLLASDTSSKALASRPDADRTVMSASAFLGSRIMMAPETVLSVT